ASIVVGAMPSESKIAGTAFHTFITGAEIIDWPAIGAEPVEMACIAPSAVLPITRAVSAGAAPGAVLDDAHPNAATIPIRATLRMKNLRLKAPFMAASGAARNR